MYERLYEVRGAIAMDLYQEMDRLTSPQFVNITARSLSREEIEQLQASGEITPLEQIPAVRSRGRVSLPADACFSDYARRARNVRGFV